MKESPLTVSGQNDSRACCVQEWQLGRKELTPDVVTELPQDVELNKWGEEMKGRQGKENTSQMRLILNV